MALPGWVTSGVLGGLAGAAEGDRANKGKAFLEYYLDKLGDIGLTAAGAGVGGYVGSRLPGVIGPVGTVGGGLIGAAIGTDEAAAARERGKKGWTPELGISEGLGAIIPGLNW